MGLIEFDGYIIRYTTEHTVTAAGEGEMADILCFSNKIPVGTISFFRENESYQNTLNNGNFHIYYHISRFKDVIQLLQYGYDSLWVTVYPDKNYADIEVGKGNLPVDNE